MTPRQVALIRRSWGQVLPIRERAAELFYDRLFTLAQDVRPLFRGDMREQGRKLTTMIGFVVARLDRLGEIVPAVEALGRRHTGYGVDDAHYEPVGRALLETLGAALGDAIGPEGIAAWADAYGTLAGVMRRAATGAPASRRPADAGQEEPASPSVAAGSAA
jgi:hemoglobin-like flavoprotein